MTRLEQDIELTRPHFESWVRNYDTDFVLVRSTMHDGYEWPSTQLAWDAWKASKGLY